MTTLERLVLGSPTGHPPADWTGARGRGAGVNLFVADCAPRSHTGLLPQSPEVPENSLAEKLRARNREKAARQRRKRGDLTMAEYRARVRSEFLARQEERRAQRQAVKLAKRAVRGEISKAMAVARAERRRENARRWRLQNPERFALLIKEWKQRNADKIRASKRERKVAKRVTLVRDLTRLQRGRCAYCRCRIDANGHVDHIVPLKRGGPDRRPNLQLTCAPCNLAKNAKDPIDFARSTGRLL